MKTLLAAAVLAVIGLQPAVAAGDEMRRMALDFSQLSGWSNDAHAEALTVFRTTCKLIKNDSWEDVCTRAPSATDAQLFFEKHFTPVMIEDEKAALFTGYYEPELAGSRKKTKTYRYPLYQRLPDMPRGEPWLTRAQIEGENGLAGKGLETAWLADPVEAFFLHVQGSGRLLLTDGSSMRVGFAGKNGHKYRSVGKEMARRGLLPPNKVSAGAIKNWVRAHPETGRQVLWHNQSFVFFHEITDLPDSSGPIGAMSRPVTTLRTIAVDPRLTPLGAPVWIEKSGKAPINRLMVAQDTGSAIKGAQRADIFFGSGSGAGKIAGRIPDGGRMVILMPKGVVAKGL